MYITLRLVIAEDKCRRTYFPEAADCERLVEAAFEMWLGYATGVNNHTEDPKTVIYLSQQMSDWLVLLQERLSSIGNQDSGELPADLIELDEEEEDET